MDKQDHLVEKFSEFKDAYHRDHAEQQVVLAKQEENLRAHMHRSELLESQMDIIRAEVIPIKSSFDMMKGVIKFITIAGIIATILKTAEMWLRH